MKSPIVFQDLEKELQPVTKYLQGRVLNAGCGQRDLSSFFIKNGATVVDNCDLTTPIQDAIICDLVDVPKESGSYDAILCNAVLEHVQFPDRVVAELRRLVKPGGYLVLCIPFLQPYHPKPDYRRYTKEGMLELARIHDLETRRDPAGPYDRTDSNVDLLVVPGRASRAIDAAGSVGAVVFVEPLLAKDRFRYTDPSQRFSDGGPEG